jgi:hypothetical protein
VNPTLSLKFDTIEPVYLEYNGQEKMVVRFTIDSEGSIGSIYTTPEQSVINSYLENKTATPPTSEPNREPRQEQGQLPTQPEN